MFLALPRLPFLDDRIVGTLRYAAEYRRELHRLQRFERARTYGAGTSCGLITAARVGLSPMMRTMVISFSGICAPGVKRIAPVKPGNPSVSSRASAIAFCVPTTQTRGNPLKSKVRRVKNQSVGGIDVNNRRVCLAIPPRKLGENSECGKPPKLYSRPFNRSSRFKPFDRLSHRCYGRSKGSFDAPQAKRFFIC